MKIVVFYLAAIFALAGLGIAQQEPAKPPADAPAVIVYLTDAGMSNEAPTAAAIQAAVEKKLKASDGVTVFSREVIGADDAGLNIRFISQPESDGDLLLFVLLAHEHGADYDAYLEAAVAVVAKDVDVDAASDEVIRHALFAYGVYVGSKSKEPAVLPGKSGT